ncbi:MAG: hypothetical protein HKP25_03055 [Marinicaulis sp.]|nr:hypothetical protein [Marinicaulis sp.]
MIIICPECATRYSIDDAAFVPNGRSVRCTSCEESWFIPPPESLDAKPDDELDLTASDEPDTGDRDPIDEQIDDDIREDRENREKKFARDRGEEREGRVAAIDDEFEGGDHDDDGEEIEPLFEKPVGDVDENVDRHAVRDRGPARRTKNRPFADFDDGDDEIVEKGWRKGRKFIVEDDDEDERGGFGWFGRKKHDDGFDDKPAPRRGRSADDNEFERPSTKRSRSHGGRREEPRVADDDRIYRDKDFENVIIAGDERDGRRKAPERSRRGERPAKTARRNYDDEFEDEYEEPAADCDDSYDEYEADVDDYKPAAIVDADWEVVGEGDRTQGFGRRVRAERRRATALARMEDVRRFDPAYFDEEFFDSLQVTPRELEKAMRKARRRAEFREKNRLTPVRAFGWSVWVAAVAGTLYAVVAYRDDIVKLAPGAADAYAVVGIEADAYGLTIENVRHRLAMSTGGPMIEISGNLANPGDNMVEAPLLQAEALGSRGELLARWTFSPSSPSVNRGGRVEFVTRAPAPEGVAEVALSFAPASTASGFFQRDN